MLLQKDQHSSPDDLDRLLERIANRVIGLHLETPVVFFLELHKPLVGLVDFASLALEPAAAPLFGAERVRVLREVVSRRENIERLLQLIEVKREGS